MTALGLSHAPCCRCSCLETWAEQCPFGFGIATLTYEVHVITRQRPLIVAIASLCCLLFLSLLQPSHNHHISKRAARASGASTQCIRTSLDPPIYARLRVNCSLDLVLAATQPDPVAANQCRANSKADWTLSSISLHASRWRRAIRQRDCLCGPRYLVPVAAGRDSLLPTLRNLCLALGWCTCCAAPAFFLRLFSFARAVGVLSCRDFPL